MFRWDVRNPTHTELVRTIPNSRHSRAASAQAYRGAHGWYIWVDPSVTTAQLIVVDLGVVTCTMGLWLTASLLLAGRRPLSRRRARLALVCIALATSGFIAQVELAMALGETGWRFAQEKLVFCLPTGAVTTVLAIAIATPSVLAAATSSTAARTVGRSPTGRTAPASPPLAPVGPLDPLNPLDPLDPGAQHDPVAAVAPIVPTALMVAASASAAGIAARIIVGFPITPLPAAVLVALVAIVGWVTFASVVRPENTLPSGHNPD
jgi:hypothetical protein